MLHIGRVGSTVLANMLSQHTNILSRSEIYNPTHDAIMYGPGFADFSPDPDPYYLIKRHMLAARDKHLLFEFKFLKEAHLKMIGDDLHRFVANVVDLGVGHFVLLERENLLKRAISGKILRDTGVSHTSADNKGELRKLHLDVERIPLGDRYLPLDVYIETVREGYHQAKAATKDYPTLMLTYEADILSDPRVGYRRCCDFFEIEPLEIAPNLGRTNPYPAVDILENAEEVEKVLSRTGDSWMLAAD